MATAVRMDRRRFLKASAQAAGALTIAFHAGPLSAAPQEGGAPAPKPLPDPNAFLRFGPDGTTTVILSHAEMGQGMWTGLVMLVAEELDLDWKTVKVEHAPAAPPYAHANYGIQMTGGSTSVSSEFDRYRQVGALARTLLVEAAAQKWGVPAASCRVEKGAVVSGTRRAPFAELTEAASKLPRPATVTLEPPSSWTIVGKPMKRLDSPEKVSGRAQFGMDVRLSLIHI